MSQSDEPVQTDASASSPPASGSTATESTASVAAPRHLRIDAEAWQRRAAAVGHWISRQLHRPRTRLAVIGVILLAIAALQLVNSMWTLPLIIVGVVMVLVAWVGSRLDGRFAIEWGESGTQLEFRAEIKAPPAPPRRLPTAVPKAQPRVPAVRIPTLAELDHGDVIEGEGHTIEIDVAELKALISAAESGESRTPAPRRDAA